MRRARRSTPAEVDHPDAVGFLDPVRDSGIRTILVEQGSRALARGRLVRQDYSRHHVGSEASTDSAAAESVAQGNFWDRRRMPCRGSVLS